MSEHKSNEHKAQNHKKKGGFSEYIKSNPWKIATFGLLILLVLSVLSDGFSNINIPSSNGSGSDSFRTMMGEGTLKGDKDAKVIIVEFSDFQCPFCKRFYDQTLPSIEKDYIDSGKVAIVYRHFPLGFHQNAQKAAEASECADDQGKFWEYHDILFAKGSGDGTGLAIADLKQYAVDLKLDPAKFNSCLDSGKYASQVQKDMADGQAAGVSGTPSFLINGELVVGAQPYAAIKAVIDRKLSGDNTVPTQPSAPSAQPSAPQAPTVIKNPSIDDDPIKGKKDAKVTIIEWSDFQCPFCKRFYDQTLPSIQKEYIDTGKVKFVFRDFPLGFHQNAQKASEASECADDQGKFWEYHDILFTKGSGDGTGLAIDDLKKYAADLKLDTTKFNSCLDSGKYASEVANDLKQGQEYGITGTPGFLINGIKISGAQPFANFKSIIDAELAK